jgi:hypothetical protein
LFGTPEIDAFASRLNTKLDKFMSWQAEPGTSHVNAFTMSWSNIYLYMFPPFSLLTRIAQKMALAKPAQVLMLVPYWQTQIWFSPLMKMLRDFPVLLPQR